MKRIGMGFQKFFRGIIEGYRKIQLSNRIFLALAIIVALGSTVGLALNWEISVYAGLRWGLPLILSILGCVLALKKYKAEVYKLVFLAAMLFAVSLGGWIFGAGSGVTLLSLVLFSVDAFLLLESATASWCLCALSAAASAGILFWGSALPGIASPGLGSREFYSDLIQLLTVFGGGGLSVYMFASGHVKQQELIAQLDEKLYYAARVDELAPVLNHKAFLKALHIAVQGKPQDLYLAKMNIDNFKRINDYYGYDIGDNILAHFARHLKRVVGEGGIIGRFGGDEFLVLIKNISEMEAKNLSEQMLWVPAFEGIPLSTSGGVARLSAPQEGKSFVKRSDRLMRESKRAGRGRITLWDGQTLRAD